MKKAHLHTIGTTTVNGKVYTVKSTAVKPIDTLALHTEGIDLGSSRIVKREVKSIELVYWLDTSLGSFYAKTGLVKLDGSIQPVILVGHIDSMGSDHYMGWKLYDPSEVVSECGIGSDYIELVQSEETQTRGTIRQTLISTLADTNYSIAQLSELTGIEIKLVRSVISDMVKLGELESRKINKVLNYRIHTV